MSFREEAEFPVTVWQVPGYVYGKVSTRWSERNIGRASSDVSSSTDSSRQGLRQHIKNGVHHLHHHHHSEPNLKKPPVTTVNLRDCGLVSPNLKPGLVYRSSQVVSGEELQRLDLNTVLDLRVMKKPCKKHADEKLRKARKKEEKLKAMMPPPEDAESSDSDTPHEHEHCNSNHSLAEGVVPEKVVMMERKTGIRMCPICTANLKRTRGVTVPVFHSDLVPWTTKLRVFSSLPGKTQMGALKEALKFHNPESMVAAAVVDPEVMGPTSLYRLLLDHSQPAIAKAMRLFCHAENYPVLVHCIHGKDRTGLVVMLLLLLCDVPNKMVVADYIESELQLKQGRDKGELAGLDDFLKSDNVIASKAETMVETIAHIEERYGNIRGYLGRVGLNYIEMNAIRSNFMQGSEQGGLVCTSADPKASGVPKQEESVTMPLQETLPVASEVPTEKHAVLTKCLSKTALEAAALALETRNSRVMRESLSANPPPQGNLYTLWPFGKNSSKSLRSISSRPSTSSSMSMNPASLASEADPTDPPELPENLTTESATKHDSATTASHQHAHPESDSRAGPDTSAARAQVPTSESAAHAESAVKAKPATQVESATHDESLNEAEAATPDESGNGAKAVAHDESAVQAESAPRPESGAQAEAIAIETPQTLTTGKGGKEGSDKKSCLENA